MVEPTEARLRAEVSLLLHTLPPFLIIPTPPASASFSIFSFSFCFFLNTKPILRREEVQRSSRARLG